MRQALRASGNLLMLLVLAGCTSTYYRAMESLGIEKRDILADRIEETRDAQADAKEQFSSALEQYRSVERAEEVRERIDSVEQVAEDLFEEWEEEIDAYSDPDLARQSRSLLSDTRTDYRDVVAAMHRAEQSMEPVLTLFNDQVMFLRHNLNARAIGALETELASLEEATATLVEEMEIAIAEASSFIEAMPQEG